MAPQSYFGGGPGTGATPAIQGSVPGSHMLFGGDEFWFFGPRVFPGDRLTLERMLYDFLAIASGKPGAALPGRTERYVE